MYAIHTRENAKGSRRSLITVGSTKVVTIRMPTYGRTISVQDQYGDIFFIFNATKEVGETTL